MANIQPAWNTAEDANTQAFHNIHNFWSDKVVSQLGKYWINPQTNPYVYIDRNLDSLSQAKP